MPPSPHSLRRIEKGAVPRALEKAERYRLLNEPWEAESICRDVLAADPANQHALACLILSITDRFGQEGARIDEAAAVAAQLSDPYSRAYLSGVIEERWGKALVILGYPRESIHRHIAAALAHFDAADKLAPPGNDDAVLRWNTCVRVMERCGLDEASESPSDADVGADSFDDDVPVR